MTELRTVKGGNDVTRCVPLTPSQPHRPNADLKPMFLSTMPLQPKRDLLLLDAKRNRLNAGPKARMDTAFFLEQVGFQIQTVPSSRSRYWQALYAKVIGPGLLQGLLAPLLGLQKLDERSRVWCQFPITRPTQAVIALAAQRGASTVAFVHDMEGLKSAQPNWALVAQECEALQGFTHVLSLNPTITQVLRDHGVHALASLDLWDYRCDAAQQPALAPYSLCVVFAGNLSAEKSGFIASLGQLGEVDFELYGAELQRGAIVAPNIRFLGSFQPDEPPFSGNGRFGLVWDGSGLDTCCGDFGAYLAYNTPHKTSMYLAKGLPVLVWRGAAVSSLVAEHKAGILIDSLHELPALLKGLSQERYAELQRHAANLGEKIRSGHFIQSAAARLIANAHL